MVDTFVTYYSVRQQKIVSKFKTMETAARKRPGSQIWKTTEILCERRLGDDRDRTSRLTLNLAASVAVAPRLKNAGGAFMEQTLCRLKTCRKNTVTRRIRGR